MSHDLLMKVRLRGRGLDTGRCIQTNAAVRHRLLINLLPINNPRR